MSLFDEGDTPEAQRPEPRPKRLAELSLRMHSANWNEGNGVVRLLAEATTAFEDATAGDGVQVGFFLNGRHVADVASDEYGMALLDDNLAAELFQDGNNELVVRVKVSPARRARCFRWRSRSPGCQRRHPKDAAWKSCRSKSTVLYRILGRAQSGYMPRQRLFLKVAQFLKVPRWHFF